MNNDSFFLLKILLRADERDALMELSRLERRDPRAQAAMLIRRALERRGLLERRERIHNPPPPQTGGERT